MCTSSQVQLICMIIKKARSGHFFTTSYALLSWWFFNLFALLSRFFPLLPPSNLFAYWKVHFINTCTTLHFTLHYTCFFFMEAEVDLKWITSTTLLNHFRVQLKSACSTLPNTSPHFSWQATLGQKCIWSALLLLHFSNDLWYSSSGKVVWKKSKWSTHYLRCNWSPVEAHLKHE